MQKGFFDIGGGLKRKKAALIAEKEMLGLLRGARSVFLLEPPYRRKYIPLGLAKISSFVKTNGGNAVFGRRYIRGDYDLVCITSLFTYDLDKIASAASVVASMSPDVPVLIGGVCASLMPKEVRPLADFVFKGYSKELDSCVPDYGIDWGIEDEWKKFCFLFTSRGCVNRCPYCAVWRIEPKHWINPLWKDHVIDGKPYAMVSDNNLSACPEEHVWDVVEYLAESGKRVVFDNGFDCKYVTPEMAGKLASLKFVRSGMRLAFDRIEEDGVFQRAINLLKDAGISKSSLMVYVLFNFMDTPKQADYRMRECVKLGIRPYPQQYTPLNKKDRKDKFIGKHWTPNLVRCFRFFWLMAGYYQKTTFEEFVVSDRGEKYRLGVEDWKVWEKK